MTIIQLVHGDCLDEVAKLNRTAALSYLDPPFFSGRDFALPDGTPAFSDKWRSLGEYMEFVVERVVRVWMETSGSLVLHVDHKTAAHLENAITPRLGPCASHVIWRYRRWPSKQRNFQRVHDVMLRWARPGATWNQLYEPLAESTRKTWKGRRQTAKVVDGRRVRSTIADQVSPGVPMGDVWDIGIIAPSSKERTGYPTQKPKALLERWILACTNPGDLVLDPFMGSGTTLEVALELGRSAVGIDTSEAAGQVASERLRSWLEVA